MASAVRQKNLRGITRLLFEGDPPKVRLGYKNETDLWDFKMDCPQTGRDSEPAWASLASDVLAFHNNRGGLMAFGITNKFNFVGATARLDSKMMNDRLRRYLPDNIWVEYNREYIQNDQRYLGLALVPPRGPVPARFRSAAPVIDGRRLFQKGGSAIRENDSTRVLTPEDADKWIQTLAVPTIGTTFAVDEPGYRILAPDYHHFVYRRDLCELIERSMVDPRVAVTSLVGVGGMGKTALATWATLRAHTKGLFDFVVSVTAKDRELTSTGIMGLESGLTSFETLLDEIADVLEFPDLKELKVDERERQVRLLLESGKGLLYVDNLETVDDARIIGFLDTLPVGTRAIVTSRRSRVRVSVRPVDIPAMNEKEIVEFVDSLLAEESFRHLAGMSPSEAVRIGKGWDGIPLAMRWSLSKAHSRPEALSAAEAASNAGSHGDELLEFSFRRVFDSLTNLEKSVLQVLAVLQQPIPIEAVFAGVGDTTAQVLDATEALQEDALVQRVFDPDRNDYAYTVLPITRSFVRRDLRKLPRTMDSLTRSLSNWFEARDVTNDEQRMVVRELRQGGSNDETALVDLARVAERRSDFDGAEKLYEQALSRSPRSWNAAYRFAEFQRHRRGNRVEALRLYAQAGANVPSRGPERAVVMREWGILLRDSGEPNAANLAIEKLQSALDETPNDLIAVGVLAGLLDSRGAYRSLIELVEPHRETPNQKFRKSVLPMLLKAYERTTELLKAAELRQELA